MQGIFGEVVDASVVGPPHDLTTCQPYIRPLQESQRNWRLAAEVEGALLMVVVLYTWVMREKR